jgi:integrase
MIDVNPVAGQSMPTKECARDRVLSDEEIGKLMGFAQADGYPFGAIYQLLLLTGQRRGEVSAMRWSEIDLQRGLWTIPAYRAKNGHAHEVPLSSAVVDILRQVPRFLHSDFVFTTNGQTPVSGFGRAKHRFERSVGSADWRVHDLRRTAASGMARLGIAPHVIEKVLNHRTGVISGVAAVYNRYG